MPAVSRFNKLLLTLFAVALAAMHAGDSGGLRFGGGEDEGSGFGGTGRMPTGDSGLGGTGYRPWLGDAGEVRVRPRPGIVSIAEQLAAEDIRPLPEAADVQPPAAVVTAPELAAVHTAEVSISDAIQTQLQRDAVIYQRIVESVEGYYPPETDRALVRTASVEAAPAPEQAPAAVAAAATPDAFPVEPVPAPAPSSPPASAGEVAGPALEVIAPDWADLVAYLIDQPPDGPAAEADAIGDIPAAQRPDRIRRPELPQVQRGRIVQRPPVLPPRVQPMRF